MNGAEEGVAPSPRREPAEAESAAAPLQEGTPPERKASPRKTGKVIRRRRAKPAPVSPNTLRAVGAAAADPDQSSNSSRSALHDPAGLLEPERQPATSASQQAALRDPAGLLQPDARQRTTSARSPRQLELQRASTSQLAARTQSREPAARRAAPPRPALSAAPPTTDFTLVPLTEPSPDARRPSPRQPAETQAGPTGSDAHRPTAAASAAVPRARVAQRPRAEPGRSCSAGLSARSAAATTSPRVALRPITNGREPSTQSQSQSCHPSARLRGARSGQPSSLQQETTPTGRKGRISPRVPETTQKAPQLADGQVEHGHNECVARVHRSQPAWLAAQLDADGGISEAASQVGMLSDSRR